MYIRRCGTMSPGCNRDVDISRVPFVFQEARQVLESLGLRPVFLESLQTSSRRPRHQGVQ